MIGLVEVICRSPVETGFALAGLTAHPVDDPVEAEPVIAALLERADLAVLLVEEPVLEGLAPETRRRLDRSARPVVVPFPGPTFVSRGSAEDRVVELLRRAIGYRVRLQ